MQTWKMKTSILQNETFAASEVVYKSGFGSPACFTKCFCEFYGYPPGKVTKGEVTGHDLNTMIMDRVILSWGA